MLILETLIINDLCQCHPPRPHLARRRIITGQQRGQTGEIGGDCVSAEDRLDVDKRLLVTYRRAGRGRQIVDFGGVDYQ